MRFGRVWSFAHCSRSCGSRKRRGSAPFPGALTSTKPIRAVSDGDGVVGPRLDIGERHLADHDHGAGVQPRKLGEVRDERLERGAQLILRRSARTGVRELGFRFKSEGGNGFVKCHVWSTNFEWVNIHPELHLRTTVEGMGRIQIDELPIGFDKHNCHHVILVGDKVRTRASRKHRARSAAIGPPVRFEANGSCNGSFPALIRAMMSAARRYASSALITPWRSTLTRFAVRRPESPPQVSSRYPARLRRLLRRN